MIERTLYESLVRKISDCSRHLENMLQHTFCNKTEWLDNNQAQAILHRSPRTLQTLRSSGKIGYSIIDGKVLYPATEICRLLNQHYKANGG